MTVRSIDLRLETLAEHARLQLGIPDDERPDPLDLLARATILGLIETWRIVPDPELPRADAQWDGRAIYIRRSVTERAQRGDADASFTVFHELSHALLGHNPRNRGVRDRRRQFGRYIEVDEEHADLLAGALMAPERLANVDQFTDAAEFARRFRMPIEKAAIRLEELKRRHRHRHGISRRIIQSGLEFDTGDYGLAIKAMMNNAEPTKRRRR
ncbi:MAG TPA: ImmA/IrrE family metallo-endopeptidase [Devosia sp.]|nr:ImmA/IrrE family metallo-endopeptidase [Devosia sp.]